MKTAGIHRVLTALYLSDHVPDLVKQGRAVVLAMKGKSAYPSPTPSPDEVEVELDKLDKAELYAKTKAPGAAKARDVQKLVVVAMLRQLESYVQALADNDVTNAATLIAGASMGIRKPSTYNKPDLAATHDTALGLVLLVGRAARGRVYYEWEWSTDQQTWTSLPRTLEAKTSFAATPMTAYAFRYRAVTKKGVGDWSAIVTLFVK